MACEILIPNPIKTMEIFNRWVAIFEVLNPTGTILIADMRTPNPSAIGGETNGKKHRIIKPINTQNFHNSWCLGKEIPLNISVLKKLIVLNF